MSYSVKELCTMFAAAKTRRQNFDHLIEDVYRYAIPYRDMMYQKVAGSDRGYELFDSTAVDSNYNFANFIHDSFTPQEYRWMEYAAGNEVPAAQRERVQTLLDAVTERFFQLLWATNFDTEINQCYQDLGGGNAVLGIRDYGKFGDDEAPATFVATPPYEIYIAEGREGHINMTFRCFEIEPYRIKVIWPDATIPDRPTYKNIENSSGNNKVKIVEACWYDYETRKYHYCVFEENDKEHKLIESETLYASWIVFRWSVVTGEVYGRGPLMNAMPDIKTANKVVELILQNASMALSGVYTAVDDGVLNPNNVELTPGTIIPVAYNGGNIGRSLDVLPRNGEFDVSQLVLNDLRQSIRRKMFDDDLAPLDGTVRSAEEVSVRQARANRRAGPSLARVRTEGLFQIVKNLTLMWQAKGLLPPFAIDGKTITLRFTSPMAKLQSQEDLQSLDAFIARMNALQPGLAPIAIKPEEYVEFVGEKTGVQFKLLNSKEQLVQVQQQMGQAIASGSDTGKAIVQGMSS